MSYSRRDLDFAAEIVAYLSQRAFQPFLDKADIAPGEPWKDRLAGLIEAADTMVFIVSPDSVRSAICGWEIAEATRLGKRIIPLVARRIEDEAAPPSLARLNYIFATPEDDRSLALAKLEGSLTQNLAWVREHTRLTQIAIRWDQGGRRRSQTLRGLDLDGAERWLSHRPGDATQPTDLHRDLVLSSRRAARMRQRAWVGGSLAVAAVAVGLAGFAEISRRHADDMLQAARGTANTLVTDLASELRDKAGMPVTLVRAVLQPALALQERLLSSAGSNFELRLDQSHALALMTVTLLRLGDTQGALKTAGQSRGIAEELFQAALGNPRSRPQLSESLRAVTMAEYKAGNLPGARLAAMRRVALLQPDAGASITAQGNRDLLDALTKLGEVDGSLDDNQGAEEALKEAVQVARAGAATAETPQDRHALVEVLVQMSVVKLQLRDAAGASAALREAYDAAMKDGADETDAVARRELANTLLAMAVNFRLLGDPAAEFASVDEGLRIFRELAWDKQNYEAQDQLAGALLAAAGLRSVDGRPGESIRDFEECVGIYRVLARDGSHPAARMHLANTLVMLGVAQEAIGAAADAAAKLDEAVGLYHANRQMLSEASASMLKRAEALLAKLRAKDPA